MSSPQESGMRPKNLPFRIAPWCLAGLLATGCSRQDGTADQPRTVSQREPIRATHSRGDHAQPLERLAAFYREWGGKQGRDAVCHAMVAHPELARFAFEGWLQVDRAAPCQWVLSERAGSRWQARLATSLLRGLPEGNFVFRGEWAAHFAGMVNGAPIISEVALGWDTRAPVEAFDWLAGLVDGQARDGAIEAVTQRWIKTDPEGASAHLAAMATGRVKDVAIGVLANSIAAEDPEAARLWIAEISEIDRRELALIQFRKLDPRD